MRTNKRVTAIIQREQKILLIYRKNNGNEYWVVPGGGVEEGESLEQALLREVMEETGLQVKKYNLLAQNSEKITFKEGEKEIEYFFYYCQVEDGEPVLGGPESEINSDENFFQLEWISIDTCSSLDLYPNNIKKILKKFKEKKIL